MTSTATEKKIAWVLPTDGNTTPAMGGFRPTEQFVELDPRQFNDEDLEQYSGILFSGFCDQIELSRHTHKFDHWLADGGRMLINGHVIRPWVTGLPKWRKLNYRGPADLSINSQSPHPIWDGIDTVELLYRTGVPGRHTLEELQKIGVAGFYGRGYYLPLPQRATVINTIGQLSAPIDIEIPIGQGQVVIHGGLDLAVFASTPGQTLGKFSENIINWLKGQS